MCNLDKVGYYVEVKPGEGSSHFPLRQPGLHHKKVLGEEEDGPLDEVLDVLEKTGRNIETLKVRRMVLFVGKWA